MKELNISRADRLKNEIKDACVRAKLEGMKELDISRAVREVASQIEVDLAMTLYPVDWFIKK